MKLLPRLKATFAVNWNTLLVGWDGLGRFSPWPNSTNEFLPLLTVCEAAQYAEERLAITNNPVEITMIVELMSIDQGASREEVRDILVRLAATEVAEEDIERRKWRLVSLEEVLNSLSDDPVGAMISLTEFWQLWGFPPDSPHEIHSESGGKPVINYFTTGTLERLRRKHIEWVQSERLHLLASPR